MYQLSHVIYVGAQIACETWPGNNIPTFKNNQDSIRKLNAMAIQLEPEC